MDRVLSDEALDILFRKARTYRAWLDKPVSDEMLRQVYDLMKWGPTSANMSPSRLLFLRTREAKERLRPALASGNIDKTMAAPVTVIVGYDLRFYEKMHKLSNKPGIGERFAAAAGLAEKAAFRNSALQGGYFIVAARCLGLDCGPMSGFDNEKVDQEFFPSGDVKSNFLCNLGYGDPSNLSPREPRLDFDEACQLL